MINLKDDSSTLSSSTIVPFKEEHWPRTATMCGFPEGITRPMWKRNFVTFHAILCGLMKWLIGSCTFTPSRRRNRVSMRCTRQSTTMTRGSVHVTAREVKMDELNYIKCRNCGKIVHYTPANTVIYYFTDYRWYSAAQTICDHCGYPQAVFLIENLDWEIRWAIKHDLGFVTMQGLPADEVADAFHKIYPEYPKAHELEDNEDALVQYFAYLLDHDPPETWFN